jgi:hypothetical protein
MVSGGPSAVAVTVSTDFRAEPHTLLNSQYFVPFEHQTMPAKSKEHSRGGIARPFREMARCLIVSSQF